MIDPINKSLEYFGGDIDEYEAYIDYATTKLIQYHEILEKWIVITRERLD